jgi:hypothetical protein
VLRVVRLSPRYHGWNREEQCALDDRWSCPRSSPQQLTAAEVDVIRELVTSEDYRHVPTGTLARLAQRLGKVFASASTWYRPVSGIDLGNGFTPPSQRWGDLARVRAKTRRAALAQRTLWHQVGG